MIKLKVQNNENNYVLNAIKKDNVYFYKIDNNNIRVEKDNNLIKIIVSNNEYANELYFKFDEAYGILKLGNNLAKYEIKLIKLIILENKVEIEYNIDDNFVYVLEEIND